MKSGIQPVRHLICVLAVFSCVWIGGCDAQLADSRDIVIEPNDIRTLVLEPAANEKTVSVKAISENEPFHLHIYLIGDETAIDQAVTIGQESDKALAGGMNKSEFSVTAKIPGGKEAGIRLQSATAKAAKVKLTISD